MSIASSSVAMDATFVATPTDAAPDLAELLDMTGDASVADTGVPSDSAATGVLRPESELEAIVHPSPTKRKTTESEVGASPNSFHGTVALCSPPGKRRTKGAAPSSNDAPRPTCEGCARVHGISPDFLVVGETCVWAHPNGKGMWCRECHTTWRTNFQHLHALARCGQPCTL